MFDRTTVYTPRVVESVTEEVHVHRAPTDESVKLLREMEAAAKAEVVKSICVGNTHFECVIQQFRTFADDSIHLTATFSLNGKKMEVAVTKPSYKQDELLGELRTKVANCITNTILSGALSRANSAWLFRK